MQNHESFTESSSGHRPGTNPRELHRELRICQSRLGTQSEQAEDFERVLQLAHELSNQITAEYLREVSSAPSDFMPALVHVSNRLLQP